MIAERYSRRLADESGFSMVEMMMTTALTLVVMATTLGALRDGFKVSDAASLGSEMQQNLGVASTLLRRDLLQTGQGIPMGGVPIPNGVGASPVVRPGPPSLMFPAGSQVFAAVTTGQALGPDIIGRATDVITLFYADTSLELDEWPLTSIAADGSTATVDNRTDITGLDNGISPGDLILFSNAIGEAIQLVTSTNGTQTVSFGPNDSLNLNQASAQSGTILQVQDAPGSYPPTSATRIWMVTYYIDDSSESPRLMRVMNDDTPRPIALDMEDFQLTYDLVDGSTNPTGVDAPVAPNSEAQIRKVNLMFFARSYKAISGSAFYLRQSLTTQVSVRNLSLFDRYM